MSPPLLCPGQMKQIQFHLLGSVGSHDNNPHTNLETI
ncbi:protein of unknown function [Pararobbsia alpina]